MPKMNPQGLLGLPWSFRFAVTLERQRSIFLRLKLNIPGGLASLLFRHLREQERQAGWPARLRLRLRLHALPLLRTLAVPHLRSRQEALGQWGLVALFIGRHWCRMVHLLFLSEGDTFSAAEISRELLEVRVWPLFSYQGPLLWQTQRLPSQAWFLWFNWTRRLLLWAEEGKTLAACSFSFFPSMVHSWAAFHTIFRSLLILDVICFLRYLSLGYPYVNM